MRVDRKYVEGGSTLYTVPMEMRKYVLRKEGQLYHTMPTDSAHFPVVDDCYNSLVP